MTIWVDADACPRTVKEVLFKASTRTKMPLILVANQSLAVPSVAWIKMVQVASGFDVADHYIVGQITKGDLLISGDIPLADEVIKQGAQVITPRGEELTASNIRQRLNMRDFMEEFRDSGMVRGGPPALNSKDQQRFANALDRWLARSPAA